MAFNREDLITWNELSTSLQNLLKAMQDADTGLENKLDENINKTNELDDRVTVLENESSSHHAIIEHILKELDIIDRVAESSLLRNVLELKAKLEFHKMDPNAHKPTINTLIRSQSDNYYSAWEKISIPNLRYYLNIEAQDHGITRNVNLEVSYPLGMSRISEEADYEKILKDLLVAWMSKFDLTSREVVINAMQEVYRDIYNHICDTDAHSFSSSAIIAKNINFVFEKGYKVFLPSKTLAMLGTNGVTFSFPNFEPINIDDTNQVEGFIKIEKYFSTHLNSTDHGLDTLEPLFNTHHMGYDTLTLAYPNDDRSFKTDVIGRTNTAAGGVDGTGAVVGMSYYVFDKFVTNAASEYSIPILVELKNLFAKHTSIYSKVHLSNDANFLVHNTNTYYEKKHIVRVPGFPANFALQATNSGITNAVAPSFEVHYDLETEVRHMRDEINLLRANIQDEALSPTEIAAQATAIKQELVNHMYGSAAHVYNSTGCMTHTTNFPYLVGETLYATNLRTNQQVECVVPGTTDKVAPDTLEPEGTIPEVEPATELNYNQYIEDTITMLNQHAAAIDAHYNAFAHYLIRHASTEYEKGDTLWAKGMNSSHMLECIVPGTTGEGDIYVPIDGETDLQNLINVTAEILQHSLDSNTHRNAYSNSIMHNTNTMYSKGDMVLAPGCPGTMALLALNDGFTSLTSPSFDSRAHQKFSEETDLENKIAELRSLNNPSAEEMATQSTEVAQALEDHKVFPIAHFYSGSTSMCHTPSTRCEVGDEVYAQNINKDYALRCIVPGITASVPPTEICDGYSDPATVDPATTENYSKYITNINSSLNDHNADKDPHKEVFCNNATRQPETRYDKGDVVVLNPGFKLECVVPGITAKGHI